MAQQILQKVCGAVKHEDRPFGSRVVVPNDVFRFCEQVFCSCICEVLVFVRVFVRVLVLGSFFETKYKHVKYLFLQQVTILFDPNP